MWAGGEENMSLTQPRGMFNLGKKRRKKLVSTSDLKSTHTHTGTHCGAQCHIIHASVPHAMSGAHWLFIHKGNIRPWNTGGYEKPFLLPPITLTSGCLCIRFVRQRVRTSPTTSPQCCHLMHIHIGSSPEIKKGGEGGREERREGGREGPIALRVAHWGAVFALLLCKHQTRETPPLSERKRVANLAQWDHKSVDGRRLQTEG